MISKMHEPVLNIGFSISLSNCPIQVSRATPITANICACRTFTKRWLEEARMAKTTKSMGKSISHRGIVSAAWVTLARAATHTGPARVACNSPIGRAE